MPAQFTSSRQDIDSCKSGYLVVGIYSDNNFTLSAKAVDNKTQGTISKIVQYGDLKDEPGSCVIINSVPGVKAKRVIVLRFGPRKKFDAMQFNKAFKGLAQQLAALNPETATIFIDDLDADERGQSWVARRLVEIIGHATYRFDQLKKPKKRVRAWKIQISSDSAAALKRVRDGIRTGKAMNEGVSLARDLGNLPGNICTPTYLAQTAEKLSASGKVEVEVLEEEHMRELGMGSFLSVSRGSREPAKLIIMHYEGGQAGAKPVALVGKGLTFDAGGISIKPAGAMDEMKFDMCGGAGVIGAMLTIATLGLPINVVGAVAASENLPDGAANKPGDIVKSMSGTTIEILNTDAEGRLILCDTLTYIGKYRPAVVIDAATLTGACVVALGRHPSGLFSNNEELSEQLVAAGQYADDRVWPMPLWEDYQSQLDSNFADLANIGGRDAGAVTAACFLSRFAKKYKWAHLDIAGTAWDTGKAKGSTGRPVPLFVQFVMNQCDQ